MACNNHLFECAQIRLLNWPSDGLSSPVVIDQYRVDQHADQFLSPLQLRLKESAEDALCKTEFIGC